MITSPYDLCVLPKACGLLDWRFLSVLGLYARHLEGCWGYSTDPHRQSSLFRRAIKCRSSPVLTTLNPQSVC
jgi:hypothetical protein